MRVDVQRLTRSGVLVASLVGLGVSIYLTFVHFAALQLVCTVSGAVNCERVLSSGYGVIAGSAVPTSAAGIVWFGVAAVLAAVRLRAPAVAGVGRLLTAWSWVGLVTIVYLVFVEIVELGAICIWCTVAHLMVLTVFILTVTIRTPDET
jgi:uncharacterized membrane protein